MTYFLVQGDTRPVVFKNFKDAAGAPVLSDSITSVAFTLKHRGTGLVKVDAATCPKTSIGSNPLACQWSPTPTDLDTPGTYDGELRFTYTDATIKRYPEQQDSLIFVVRPKHS